MIDYHMHLVDDYHIDRCPYTPERVEEYVRAAEAAGVDEIGVTDHCHRFVEFAPLFEPIYKGPRGRDPEVAWLKDNLYEPLDRYVEALVRAQQRGWPVKIGLEVDWFPGAEDVIRSILAPYPWDYVLGSVHFLGDWPLDVSAGYGWPDMDVAGVYAEYFTQLEAAARSGLYDVLAHPDLVKKFGHRADGAEAHYEAVVAAMAEAGVAMEISTAGLRCPARELYPAPAMLELAASRGVAVTFGSDAHDPQTVGQNMDKALTAARQAGITFLSTYEKRQRKLVPLPSG